MVLLSEENLVLQAKKGALCTLGSNRIIWPYLECGAGVLTRKLPQIFLLFAFMVKKCLLTFYDEIYYKNGTSVCNGVFPIETGVGGVFLSVSKYMLAL